MQNQHIPGILLPTILTQVALLVNSDTKKISNHLTDCAVVFVVSGRWQDFNLPVVDYHKLESCPVFLLNLD